MVENNDEFELTLSDEDKQKASDSIISVLEHVFNSFNDIVKKAEEQTNDMYKNLPSSMRFKDFAKYIQIFEKSEKKISRQQLAQYISYGYLPKGIVALGDTQATYTYEHFFRCLFIQKLKKYYSFEMIASFLDYIPVDDDDSIGETLGEAYLIYTYFEQAFFDALLSLFENETTAKDNMFINTLIQLSSNTAAIKASERYFFENVRINNTETQD